MKIRVSSFAAWALISSSMVFCAAQTAGSIHVIVLGEDNKPVQGAQVIAPRSGKFQDMYPMCKTLEDGACTIRGILFDRYSLSASKWYDGYPCVGRFYSGSTAKETIVALSKKSPAAEVVLHVGPRAGFLKLVVTDAVTGKEILPVSFRFRWASDPDNAIMSGRPDDLTLLIPADVPVTFVASSAGYEDWTYASPDDSSNRALRLRSGERLTLHIPLQPKR